MNAALYTDNATTIETSSGITTQPPRMLKRCNSGTSQVKGTPAMKVISHGIARNNPRLVQNTGNICPVACRRARAQRLSKTTATSATSNASQNAQKPSAALGAGICTPRLLTNTASHRLRLLRGPGHGLITAKTGRAHVELQ